jgi:hypothetical protein
VSAGLVLVDRRSGHRDDRPDPVAERNELTSILVGERNHVY